MIMKFGNDKYNPEVAIEISNRIFQRTTRITENEINNEGNFAGIAFEMANSITLFINVRFKLLRTRYRIFHLL